MPQPNPATAAAEIKSNIGLDLSLSFELSDYAESEAAEDVDLMTREQRQALNLRMAEWYAA